MKLATNIIVAAALVFVSAPAFAHGGGMGGIGHGNTMSNTVVIHNPVVNTKTTKTTFLKRLEVVRIQREIRRLDREILRLIKKGLGNTPVAQGLEMQRAKLLQEQHLS